MRGSLSSRDKKQISGLIFSFSESNKTTAAVVALGARRRLTGSTPGVT